MAEPHCTDERRHPWRLDRPFAESVVRQVLLDAPCVGVALFSREDAAQESHDHGVGVLLGKCGEVALAPRSEDQARRFDHGMHRRGEWIAALVTRRWTVGKVSAWLLTHDQQRAGRASHWPVTRAVPAC